jgi:hypothetical protein
LDVLAETYWRWATRDDALACLTTDLGTALKKVTARLAPEGTDGDAFAAWVGQAFADCRDGVSGRSMTECMAMALEPQWRVRWDATYVVCDYRVDWRRDTRKLSTRR